MAGMAGTGMAMQGMGTTLGAIGDIFQASGYDRPQLAEPGGQERRLRQLAQNQLLGGGMQALGGTTLYNQLAPLLMGMLPGMRYVPGAASGGAGGGAGGLGDYQDALRRMQEQQQVSWKLRDVKRQLRGKHLGRETRQNLRQERKSLRQQRRTMPTAPQLERQAYRSGTQVPTFDVRRAESAGPSADTLAAIRGMMDAEAGNPPMLGSDGWGMAGGNMGWMG